jgi:hypothetical protein
MPASIGNLPTWATATWFHGQELFEGGVCILFISPVPNMDTASGQESK